MAAAEATVAVLPSPGFRVYLQPLTVYPFKDLLGGSWVVVSEVIRVTIVITHIRGLIPPLITTQEPPSMRGRVRKQGALKKNHSGLSKTLNPKP